MKLARVLSEASVEGRAEARGLRVQHADSSHCAHNKVFESTNYRGVTALLCYLLGRYRGS